MRKLCDSVANGNERILMTFEQGERDGYVDVIVWDVAQDESGVIRRGVRHGYEISAGDMVLLFDHLANLAKRS